MIVSMKPQTETSWLNGLDDAQKTRECIDRLTTARRTYVRRLEGARSPEDRALRRAELNQIDRNIFRVKSRLAKFTLAEMSKS